MKLEKLITQGLNKHRAGTIEVDGKSYQTFTSPEGMIFAYVKTDDKEEAGKVLNLKEGVRIVILTYNGVTLVKDTKNNETAVLLSQHSRDCFTKMLAEPTEENIQEFFTEWVS